jgi:tetratricopeptide (TPR) repeat protein
MPAKTPGAKPREVKRGASKASFRPASPRPAAQPAVETGAAERAATVLFVMIALLVAARIGAAFAPGMWAWGIDAGRFLPVWIAAPLLLALVLPLLPAVSRRLTPWIEAGGDAIARTPVPAAAMVLGLAAGIALLLADRVHYVGDFLLRDGAVSENIDPSRVFPQALWLDSYLHYTVPTLMRQVGLAPDLYPRLTGALELGLLGALAVGFARMLGLAGGAATAAVAVILGGGYAGMFTGYGKAIVEVCLLTGAVGVLGLNLMRTGRGGLWFGAALALAIALHRSALALVPGAVLAVIFAARSPESRARLFSPLSLVGLGLPVGTFALVAPKIWRVVTTIDTKVHLRPAESAGASVLAAAFTPLRMMDFANLALMLSPLALAIPLMVLALGRGLARGRELLLLVVFAIPLVGFVPFIHPYQGIYRDWDNFTPAGVALSVVVAWLAGEVLRVSKRAPAIATATTAFVVVSTLMWLGHHAMVNEGLRRMEAFTQEPPERTENELAATWDYLGSKTFRMQRFEESARHFKTLADRVPNTRFILQWALAEESAGKYAAAQAAYRRMIDKVPQDPVAWRGYAVVSMRMGDRTAARHGAQMLLRYHPGDPDALAILEALETQK